MGGAAVDTHGLIVDSKGEDKATEKLVCPNCLTEFNHEDMHEARKKLAAQILHGKGFSLREVGKMLDMHPQTVKYWAGKPSGSAPKESV